MSTETPMNLRGICPDMCSRREADFRIREDLIHVLETKNGKPHCLVKEFVRSAAGREDCLASDMRTPGALKRTVDYLINKITTLKKINPALIYEFVFDRLRAVRQDMVIQCLNGHTAIYILEEAVLFYLHSINRMKDASFAVFDPKMNSTHLLECLKQLLVQYENNNEDDGESSPSDNTTETLSPEVNRSGRRGRNQSRRAEFESYYILINLGHQEALTHFLNLPIKIRNSSPALVAWRLNCAVIERNYVRAIRLIERFDKLCLAAVKYHHPILNRNLLQIMNTGYSSKACCYPLLDLERIFCLSSEHLLTLITDCGITVEQAYVRFNKAVWSNQAT